jgi:hypothetical protein
LIGLPLSETHRLGYSDVLSIYLNGDSSHHLTKKDIEQVIVSTALQQYDNASNGNKNRGQMKKASEMYVLRRLE